MIEPTECDNFLERSIVKLLCKGVKVQEWAKVGERERGKWQKCGMDNEIEALCSIE